MKKKELCERSNHREIHLNIKIKNTARCLRNARKKQWLWTAMKTCVSLVFVFACFVFAGVFISDEGAQRREPRRVCQAPVSMQAIISASFEVYVCVC